MLLSSFAVLSFGAEEIVWENTSPITEDLQAKEEAKALLEKDAVYDALYQGLLAGMERIDISGFGCTPARLQELYQDMIYTCPELFYIDTGASYSYTWDGRQYVKELHPTYLYADEELAAKKEEYNALMNELYALGSMEWSDLETALFYHDYLTAYYQYDTDYEIYDAYGFLKNKEGVCQAYTLVFKGLMDHFDVPCTYAQSNNINHIWNVVFVDGEWFHLDATWDDPVNDRPGRAKHDHFLIGSETNETLHFTNKHRQNDMVLGVEVPVSSDDHAYSAVWKNSQAPFVEASGFFYGIVIVEETVTDAFGGQRTEKSAKFAEVHFRKGGQVTSYDTLSMMWGIPGENAYYSGNYSGICTDGRYVYYSDETTIYRYDPEEGMRTSVKEYNDNRVICGLLFEGGKLLACLGRSPYDPLTIEEASVKLPVYHTITWIIDDQRHYSVAEEGTVPEFDGSTWKENEGGFSYVFIGWTPELSEAYCEMTYVAIYAVVPEFVLGDINGDGDVTIGDVAGLLDYLANPETANVNLSALDTDGNGSVTISDVSVLLDFLAGKDVVLN